MFRKSLVVLCVLFLLIICIGYLYTTTAPKDLLKGVTHLNHSTLKIARQQTIYFDPVNIEGEPKDADLIFLTHTHGDHLNIEDIKKVMKDTTTFIVPADAVATLDTYGIKNILEVVPDKNYSVSKMKFKTIPAYNVDKNFHPKNSNWIGYVVYIDRTAYYIAGDTDLIPEMKQLKVDVAFLPVGGTYTMDAKEAIEAANTIKPRIAVPIHFGAIVGTAEDAKTFIEGLSPDIQGILLKE